jgi:hypothetical protein
MVTLLIMDPREEVAKDLEVPSLCHGGDAVVLARASELGVDGSQRFTSPHPLMHIV